MMVAWRKRWKPHRAPFPLHPWEASVLKRRNTHGYRKHETFHARIKQELKRPVAAWCFRGRLHLRFGCAVCMCSKPSATKTCGFYVQQNLRPMGWLHLTKSETRFNTDKTITYNFFVRPEAGFLVRVHPEPCLIRAQIRALLCPSKSKVHPCLDLNFAGSRQKKRPLSKQLLLYNCHQNHVHKHTGDSFVYDIDST
jgi:hypothetical protein